MIFLVGNCTGYMQVSYFHREDIEYTHYLQGMKQIIVIHEDDSIVPQTSSSTDCKKENLSAILEDDIEE